jgi:hypothetical protein
MHLPYRRSAAFSTRSFDIVEKKGRPDREERRQPGFPGAKAVSRGFRRGGEKSGATIPRGAATLALFLPRRACIFPVGMEYYH